MAEKIFIPRYKYSYTHIRMLVWMNVKLFKFIYSFINVRSVYGVKLIIYIIEVRCIYCYIWFNYTYMLLKECLKDSFLSSSTLRNYLGEK